jgi:hypothetical protein
VLPRIAGSGNFPSESDPEERLAFAFRYRTRDALALFTSELQSFLSLEYATVVRTCGETRAVILEQRQGSLAGVTVVKIQRHD